VSFKDSLEWPWNLKNRLSFTGHLRFDIPSLLVARMNSSSTSSTHSAGVVASEKMMRAEGSRTDANSAVHYLSRGLSRLPHVWELYDGNGGGEQGCQADGN
jgi:hypothetical protein